MIIVIIRKVLLETSWPCRLVAPLAPWTTKHADLFVPEAVSFVPNPVQLYRYSVKFVPTQVQLYRRTIPLYRIRYCCTDISYICDNIDQSQPEVHEEIL